MSATVDHLEVLQPGVRLWYPDGENKWLAGSLVSEEGGLCIIKLDNGRSVPKVPLNSLQPANPLSLESLPDMCQLAYLNPPGVLHNLSARLRKGDIYTFAGPVLIAVNPCRALPLYTEEIAAQYAGGKMSSTTQFGPTPLESLPPHIYLVAATAFREMVREGRTQSLLVSGESGAGKTETTKRAMQYFATLAGGGGVEHQVLETNPILEAFGNAKTSRNPNSSRFGKLLQIRFTHTHRIAGAAMKTYLLEKPRVVAQLQGERSYHIFYQLLVGAEREVLERLHLMGMGPNDFKYLSGSGCTTVEGMDDAAEFKAVREAMSVVGMDASTQQHIMSLLAGILWLGNVEFSVEQKGDTVSAKLTPALEYAAELLGMQQDLMVQALTTVKLKSATELIIRNNNLEAAINARDALAKSIYNALFTWVVEQINTKLDAGQKGQGPLINILDIFGFEEFKVNSFEQLCINYTNERLQQQFNTHLFDLQREEYREEGLKDVPIEYDNNSECVDMIERFPPKGLGVLSVLDSQCKVPRPTDEAFLVELTRLVKSDFLKYNPRKRHEFTIVHYAGTVSYHKDGFVEKNKDTISPDLVELLTTTRHPLLEQLAPMIAAEAGDAKKGKMSVGMRFSGQLHELTSMLDNTALHFIRCIKPSATLTPGEYDSELVLQQLRSSGVMEVVRLAKAGYPSRYDCHTFCERYSVLLPGLEKTRQGESSQQAVKRLLDAFGVEPATYLMGHTKVFFKAGIVGRIEDQWSRNCRVASVLQCSFRCWHWRTWFLGQQRAAVTLQSAARVLAARRMYEERHRIQECALKIVHAWRGFVLRQAFKRTVRNIVLVQMCVRRMLFHRRVARRVLEREKRELMERLAEEEKRRQQEDFELVRRRLNVSLEEVMAAVEAYVVARDAGEEPLAAAAATTGVGRLLPASGGAAHGAAGVREAATGGNLYDNQLFEEAQAALRETQAQDLGPVGKLARLQLQNMLLQHQIQLGAGTSLRNKYQHSDLALSGLSGQVQKLQEYISSLMEGPLGQQLPPPPALVDLVDARRPPVAALARLPVQLPRPPSVAAGIGRPPMPAPPGLPLQAAVVPPPRLKRVEEELSAPSLPLPQPAKGDAALSEDLAWQHVHRLKQDFDRVRGVLEDGVQFISEAATDPNIATEDFEQLKALNILMAQFKVWREEFNEQLTKTRVVLLAGRSKVALIKQRFEDRVHAEQVEAYKSASASRRTSRDL